MLRGTTFHTLLERGDEDGHTVVIFIVIATVLMETHAFKVIDDYPSVFDCTAENEKDTFLCVTNPFFMYEVIAFKAQLRCQEYLSFFFFFFFQFFNIINMNAL